MLTVKFCRVHEEGRLTWDIIACERFEVFENSENLAVVTTYKSMPSRDGISWNVTKNPVENFPDYHGCYVENMAGKTVYKFAPTLS
jgi:hypothetical protein